MRSAALAICLCLALVAGCAKVQVKGPQRLKVGAPAPAFNLLSLAADEEINFAKTFQASVGTVVVIWSMACPTCREALVDCDRIYRQYSGEGISFVGVNFDLENVQGVRAFLKSEGIGFVNAWDPRTRAARAYRAADYTFSVFIVNRDRALTLVQYDHPPDLGAMLSKALDQVIANEVKAATPGGSKGK